MKYRYILAVLLAFTVVACTEGIDIGTPEEESVIEEVKPFNKTFSASFTDNDNVTKTSLLSNNSVVFTSGDAIGVFDVSFGDDVSTCSSKTVKFNMDGGPYKDGSASFAGRLENEQQSYVAAYPFQSESYLEVSKFMNGVPSNYTVHVNIPAVQKATPGSFDPAANISIAKSESTENGDILYFRNICSLIKFKVPAGESYTKVVFRANDSNCSLAGEWRASMSISAALNPDFASTIGDNASHAVTLSGKISEGVWYYIAVNSTTLSSGFSIDMYDTDTHLAGTKTLSRKVELKRSDILNIGEISGDWLGSGTYGDPYRISSYPQLKLLAQRFATQDSAKDWKGKYYLQTADIDCNGEYIRIGGLDESDVNSVKDVFFEGHYDGDNYKIKNFKLKGQDKIYGAPQYYGLFAQVKNSSFYNMVLEPASIFENPTNGKQSDQAYYIGTLIAMAMSSDSGIEVRNCHVSSDKQFAFTPDAVTTIFGGLVGYCCEKFEMYDCTNDMDLYIYNDRGNVNGGGLVGVLSAPLTILDYDVISYIEGCRNTADLTVADAGEARQSVVGGIVGMTFDTGTQDLTLRLCDCVNNGNISAYSDDGYSYAAGILAFQDSDGDYNVIDGSTDPYIYNSLNTGNIHAEGGDGSLSNKTGTFAGGICGYVYDDDTHFALCANTGSITISGDDQIGAISASNGSCLWCYWLNAKSHTESGASSSLPCTKDGKATNCYYYKSLGAGTMNNRRTGSDGKGGDDIVLDDTNTEWSNFRWILAGEWSGSSTFGATGNTLDIILN